MQTRGDHKFKAISAFFMGAIFLGWAYAIYSPTDDPSQLAFEGVLFGLGLAMIFYAARATWRLRSDSRIQQDRRSRTPAGYFVERRLIQLRLTRADRRSRSNRRRPSDRRFNIERGEWNS